MSAFIYTYVWHGDEHDLCQLEMRAFFGHNSSTNVLKSPVAIDPRRSPFIKERLEVLYEADNWKDLVDQAEKLQVDEATFKVVSLNTMDLGSLKKVPHEERRRLEREIGLRIPAEPDLDHPEAVFGFLTFDERWYFGKYMESESVWYRHITKPHSYSTALSTRVARAVANIAVPHPEGVKAIDPCCGIGNVLVEALSMGIDIVGSDINWLVIGPARENIAYFGLEGEVKRNAISEVTKNYDVAIIDMPYNIFSKVSPEEHLDILRNARRITKKAVIVTIDTIDDKVKEVGFSITDRCEAKKGTFIRQVLVCE